jgi:hypothetical protein
MDRGLPSTWQLLRSSVFASNFPWSLSGWYRLVIAVSVLALFAPISLVNRLAVGLDNLLFPGFQGVEIRRPLFIVGPPRSGTTMLHRLIAVDSAQFTTFCLWELIFAPAICQKLFWINLGRADTCLGAPGRRGLEVIQRWIGRNRVHPTALDAPEEDHLLLLSHRACFLLVLAFPWCSRVWNLGYFDQRIPKSQQLHVLFRYRRLLQRHLYVRGATKTLVSKNPSFSGWLQALNAEFPDARFIGLLRRPDEALPSQLSSVRRAMHVFGYDVRHTAFIESFVSLFVYYYEHVVAQLQAVGPSKARLLKYTELKTSPAEQVVETLRQLGYSISDENRRHLAIEGRRARSYSSRHRYALSDFGLTSRQLRRQLSVAYSWFDHRADPHLPARVGSEENTENARDHSDTIETA